MHILPCQYIFILFLEHLQNFFYCNIRFVFLKCSSSHSWRRTWYFFSILFLPQRKSYQTIQIKQAFFIGRREGGITESFLWNGKVLMQSLSVIPNTEYIDVHIIRWQPLADRQLSFRFKRRSCFLQKHNRIIEMVDARVQPRSLQRPFPA